MKSTRRFSERNTPCPFLVLPPALGFHANRAGCVAVPRLTTGLRRLDLYALGRDGVLGSCGDDADGGGGGGGDVAVPYGAVRQPVGRSCRGSRCATGGGRGP